MRSAALRVVLVVALAACGSEAAGGEHVASSEPAEETAPAITPEDRAAARDRFENHCASCHGMDGRGRGPVAASLNPSPRDWTDPDWQASVTDEDLRIVILEGGKGLGLSSLMPASRLADRPGVVEGLVGIVRGFGK